MSKSISKQVHRYTTFDPIFKIPGLFPLIFVRIFSRLGSKTDHLALLDSAAAISLISPSLAIDLDFKDYLSFPKKVIHDPTQHVWGHEIILKFAISPRRKTITAPVLVCPDIPGKHFLLGRKDVFDKFLITIMERQRRVQLDNYPR